MEEKDVLSILRTPRDMFVENLKRKHAILVDIEGILNRKVAGAQKTLLVKKKFLPPLSKKEE